jgi:hypothetical protein
MTTAKGEEDLRVKEREWESYGEDFFLFFEWGDGEREEEEEPEEDDLELLEPLPDDELDDEERDTSE